MLDVTSYKPAQRLLFHLKVGIHSFVYSTKKNISVQCKQNNILGCIPLGIIIKTRRLNYLHHLVTRNESEMLWKIFTTQWNNPTKGDWSEQVKEDLELFGICPDLDWIKSKSKFSFKRLVKSKAKELGLEILIKMKEKHSKMSQLEYIDLEMQNYFKNDEITVSEARVLFKFRTRMIKCWGNFKGGRPPEKCPICQEDDSRDTQDHAFKCRVIKHIIKIEGEYDQIFTQPGSKEIAKTAEKLSKLRAELIEE